MNITKILVSLLTLLIFLSCSFLDSNMDKYPQSIYESKDLKFYSIDSKTFLDNLKQGNSDILTLITTPPDPYPLPPEINKSYMWTYQEYLNTKDFISKKLWADELQGWELRSMYFNVDCQDSISGFTMKLKKMQKLYILVVKY